MFEELNRESRSQSQGGEGEKGLQIDLYGDLAGILSIAQKKNDINNVQELKRLRLLSSNDNNSEALVDSVGSGGQI